MGLDTSHDAWHGGYGSFNRFRDYLAEIAGYPFKEESIYGSSYTRKVIDIDWSQYQDKNIKGEWDKDKLPKDPLMFLICHSDCDGYLEPEHCKLLADRLKELLPTIPEGTNLGGHVQDVKEKTEQFIDGLLLAYENNERLGFY